MIPPMYRITHTPRTPAPGGHHATKGPRQPLRKRNRREWKRRRKQARCKR